MMRTLLSPLILERKRRRRKIANLLLPDEILLLLNQGQLLLIFALSFRLRDDNLNLLDDLIGEGREGGLKSSGKILAGGLGHIVQHQGAGQNQQGGGDAGLQAEI